MEAIVKIERSDNLFLYTYAIIEISKNNPAK